MAGAALPDEIMLAILGLVDDGLTLLDSVPLVCKRWRRLARDWRAWAGVRVAFEYHHWRYSPNLVGTLDLARVLLLAPALGCVTLDTFHRPEGAGARLFLSALRRSRAALLRLETFSCYSLPDDVRQALYERLWRSRDRVRDLYLQLPLDLKFPQPDSSDEDYDSDDSSVADGGFVAAFAAGLGAAVVAAIYPGLPGPEDDDQQEEVDEDVYADGHRQQDPVMTVSLDGEEVSVAGLLGRLQGLESMFLELHPSHGYAGELRGLRLPRLATLGLCSATLEFGPEALAVDLLDAVAGPLRRLELPSEALPTAVLEAASRCAGVRRLHVALVDVAAVAHGMPRLRSLYAGLSSTLTHELTAAQVQAGRRALRDAPAALAGLEDLTIEVLGGGDGDGGLPVEELKRLVAETVRAASGVTSLSLYGRYTTDLLGQLAASSPRVRRLSLSLCGSDYAAPVAAMAELRELEVGIPDSADRKAYEAAVEDFRRRRPDVVVKA